MALTPEEESLLSEEVKTGNSGGGISPDEEAILSAPTPVDPNQSIVNQIESNLDVASKTDPVQAAKWRTLATETGVPRDVVERNQPEIERLNRLNSIKVDPNVNPATAKLLAEFEAAEVAYDNVDKFKDYEDSVNRHGFWVNNALLAAETGAGIIGNFVGFAETIVRSIPGTDSDFMNQGIRWNSETNGFEAYDTRESGTFVGEMFSKLQSEHPFGGENRFTPEQIKKDPSLANMGGFAIESTVGSLPYMLASVANVKRLAISEAQRHAEAIAENKGKEDPTLVDLAQGLPLGIATALIDRLAAGIVLTKGGIASLGGLGKAVGEAAVVEGGTEAVQGGTEYIGQRLGTKADITTAGLLEDVFWNAMGGVSAGGTIKTVTGTAELTANKMARKQVQQFQEAVVSHADQARIDEIVSFAQGNDVKDRDISVVKKFLDGFDDGTKIRIDAEVITQMRKEGLNVPELTPEQMVTGELTMSVADFATGMALDDAVLTRVRPHVKLSEGALTQAQMESRDIGADFKKMMNKSIKDKTLRDEAQLFEDKIVEQLVATGKLTERDARLSAILTSSKYATDVQKRRDKGDKEMTIGKLAKQFGFDVFGPDATVPPAPADATIVNQGGDVVDDQGKPMVVYHGTNRTFDEFNMDEAVDGAHWFTADKKHAGTFGNVGAYHVSMKNPMTITQQDLDAKFNEMNPDGDDSVLPRDFVDVFIQKAKSEGYDGLVIKGMEDRDITADMYLPFTSTQIRSATDNQGGSTEIDPQAFYDAQLADKAKRNNMTDEQADIVRDGPDTDMLTGLYSGDELISSLNRGLSGDSDSLYVESDTYNLGGINKAMGANSKADAVIKAIGDAYAKAFPGVPVFRRGGARFAAIVPKDFDVDAAKSQLDESIKAIAEKYNLTDIPGARTAQSGIAMYTGVSPLNKGNTVDETVSKAQNEIKDQSPQESENVDANEAFETWVTTSGGQAGGIARRIAEARSGSGREGEISREETSGITRAVKGTQNSPLGILVDPEKARNDEDTARAEAAKLNDEQRKEFARKTKRDPVTGWFTDKDRAATIKRVQKLIGEGGAAQGMNAVYISADIGNLGGINRVLGNKIADTVFNEIASATLESIMAIPGIDVVPFRHGGDEVSFIILGASVDQVRSALAMGEQDVQRYVNAIGLQDLPHAKAIGNTAKYGSGVYTGATPFSDQSDISQIFDDADEIAENAKYAGKPDVKGETLPLVSPLNQSGSLREQIRINLSAAVSDPAKHMPGLTKLYEDANNNDKAAISTLQYISHDTFSFLTSGIDSAVISYNNTVGLFGGTVEPSVALTIDFDPKDRDQILAAIGQFGRNFKQDQIHMVESSESKDDEMHEYPDSGYDTSLVTIDLNRPLTRQELDSVIGYSGLYGMNTTDDRLEFYFVGDVNNEEEHRNFEEQTRRAVEAVKSIRGGEGKTAFNAWRVGTRKLSVFGDGGIEYPAGDLNTESSEANNAITHRIAELTRGGRVTPVQQKGDYDLPLHRQIAQAYEELPLNDTGNPMVRRAYEALATETIRQYKALPIKVWRKAYNGATFRDGRKYGKGEPYANSSAMRHDVLNNNTLVILGTDAKAFGPEGIVYDDHPLLRDSGLTDEMGKPMLINDLFRAIHDYYAHTLSPTHFGPKGEEAAWRNHMAMTRDPWARWALTTETRGQNSWVNSRPEVQGLPLADRGFAIQKVGLLPIKYAMTGDAYVDEDMKQLAESFPDDDAETLFQNNNINKGAFEQWSRGAPLIDRVKAIGHEFKSGVAVTLEAFHGTRRPDRVGVKFLKRRATSGPMAFHTSGPDLASNYAQNKADTSLANDNIAYKDWFKVKVKGSRVKVDIERAWFSLDSATRATITERMGKVTLDEDGLDVIYDENNTNGIGSYDWEYQQTQRRGQSGNPLKAAVESWLNSGAVFNEEERFLKVLELAGFPMDTVEFDHPWAAYPFVYHNYIRMQKPLVTTDLPADVIEALNAAAKRDRSRKGNRVADQWDKSNWTLREWVAAFNEDPTHKSHVWTSIPDKVTDVFRSLGYDGIIDASGKSGGAEHHVYIPFEENQVKSAIGNRGTFDESSNILFQEAQRNNIGLYSAIEHAVINLNLPQWKKAKGKPLTTEEKARYDELEVDVMGGTRDLSTFETIEWSKLRDKIKANIPTARGRDIWAKLKGEPGIQKMEYEFLGLEEYLDTDSMLSRQQVIEYIRNNGPVFEVVEDTSNGMPDPDDIDWNESEYDYYESGREDYDIENARDIVAEFEEDPEGYDFGQHNWSPARDWFPNNTAKVVEHYGLRGDEAQLEMFDETERKLLDSMEPDALLVVINNRHPEWLEDFAEDVGEGFKEHLMEEAQEQYYSDPDMVYEYEGYTIRYSGGEYAVYTRRGHEAGTAYSLNEAQIMAMDAMRDNGDLGGTGGTRWSQYVSDGEYDEYTETRYTLPNNNGTHTKTSHFPESNTMYFVRKTQRGNEHRIEEGQTDWVSDQRKLRQSALEQVVGIVIRDHLNNGKNSISDEQNLERDLREYDLKTPKSDLFWELKKKAAAMVPKDLGWDTYDNETIHNDIQDEITIKEAQVINKLFRDAGVHHEQVGDRPSDEVVQKRGDILGDSEELMGLRREKFIHNVLASVKPLPKPPYTDDAWISLMMKRELIVAVENGSKYFSWVTGDVVQEGWSDKYEYRPQYDQKMVSIVRKLTGIQPERDGDVWKIELTRELRDRIESEAFTMFQKPPADEPRGSITMPTATNPNYLIRLLSAGDRSTFLHEASHLFLEMERDFVRKYGVDEDQQALLDWFGIASFEQITREEHEKFAETFETYLMEGKAPSVRLRNSFRAFKNWLLNVYKLFGKQDPRLSRADLQPEIAEFFDKMLATKEEIEMAAMNPQFEGMFDEKHPGMTDEEWTKYQEQKQKRGDKAEETAFAKVVKELKARKSKEWAEERKVIIDAEVERLELLPVYKLMKDLSVAPMDNKALKEIVGYDKAPGKLIGKVKNDGVDPQEYAEAYGYRSVQEMYDDIVKSDTVKKTAYDNAEAQLVEKYGDILNDGSIEQEALEALHNEEQAELVLMEMRALNKRGADQFKRELLKQNAKDTIAKLKYDQIQPNQFYQAEIRAAKKAATAKTDEEKFKYKVQQIINHYLYKEAVETKERMETHRKYIRGVQTRDYPARYVDTTYSANMRAIANMYDMRTNPQRIQTIRGVLEWYKGQLGPDTLVDVTLLDHNLIKALEADADDKLLTLAIPTFDDLTAEELAAVVDQLKHLRHVGGLLSEESREEVRLKAEKLADSITANGGKDRTSTPGVKRRGDEIRESFNDLVNRMPSLRNLMRKLDNAFKDRPDGRGFEYIYRPIEDAVNRKLAISRKIYDEFKEDFKEVHKLAISRKIDKTYTLSSGGTMQLNSEGRVMMALYWGTESSREAILQGFGMNERDVMTILSDLTVPQLETVNKLWKMNESIWPELSAASIARHGVAPPKLDATPFEVNGVKMTGGHMRLFYDAVDIDKRIEQTDAEMMQSIMPTKAGSLHARVGSGGRPVLLDINNIAKAINENIHYIAFAEMSSEVSTILHNKNVKAAIERKHGRGFWNALTDNVKNITANRNEREAVRGLAKITKLARNAATMKHLAWSIRNTIQQFSGVKIVADEVGVIPFINSLSRIFLSGDEGATREFIHSRSQFMSNRTSLVNREAAEHLNKINVSGKAEYMWKVSGELGFAPQTAVDSLFAYPVWLATYERQLGKHGDDKLAASEADTAVSESVGSGSDLHAGALYQGNNTEFIKLMTSFGSWFNAYYNRVYRETGGFTPADLDYKAVRAVVMTPLITAVVSSMLIMDTPDEDEDWFEWAAKSYAGFMFAMIPLVRDVAGAFKGYTPKTAVSGLLESPAALYNEIRAYNKGNQSLGKTAVDVTKYTVTSVVPIPGSGQLLRIADFMESNSRGEETGSPVKKTYQAMVKGPEK